MANLKSKLASGAQTVGFGLRLRSTREDFERALESGPYDFVFVDSQHSPFDEFGLVEFCGIAGDLGLPVRLRTKHARQSHLIGNLLDLGPTGIEVPQVESVAAAQEAAENLYYPPVGRRSVGGGARVGVQDHGDVVDYARWWNETGVLWLQVESLQAVLMARQLALPGVDCLSFGPTDLALDIARHPNPPYDTVEECVTAVARAVEGTGTVLDYRNGTPDQREKWADLGVTVFLEAPVAR